MQLIYVSKSIATRQGVITFMYMYTGILRSGNEACLARGGERERKREREREREGEEEEYAKCTCVLVFQNRALKQGAVHFYTCLYTYMYTGMFKPSIETRHCPFYVYWYS